MKMGMIGLMALVLIIGTGTFLYLNQYPKHAEQITQTQSEDKIAINDKKTIDSNLVVGSDSSNLSEKYLEYGARGFGPPTDPLKRRVYFFYADWCPTCRPVDTEIKTNLSRIPDDVVIIRVNYNDDYTDDSEKALAQEFGVSYQHTFVQVDANGNEITKWNGGGLDNLLSKIK